MQQRALCTISQHCQGRHCKHSGSHCQQLLQNSLPRGWREKGVWVMGEKGRERGKSEVGIGERGGERASEEERKGGCIHFCKIILCA